MVLFSFAASLVPHLTDPNNVGAAAGVASTYLAGVSFKRDAYSDNVAMRQAQLYQEKSYHIAWVVAVREEIRDIMTIFVGRMTNFMVVETLIIAIVAAIICEGEVHPDCPEFIVNAMYMCLAVSAMFLAMSLMFAVKGTLEAYFSSMQFLTQVVPDPLDPYSFDYLQQTTTHFFKEPNNRLWVPGISLGMPESYQQIEKLNKGACRFVHFDVTVNGLDYRSMVKIVNGPQCLELIVKKEVANFVEANMDKVYTEIHDGTPVHTRGQTPITKVHVRVLFYSIQKAMRAQETLTVSSSGFSDEIRNSIVANELFLVGRAAVAVVDGRAKDAVEIGDVNVRYETLMSAEDAHRGQGSSSSSSSASPHSKRLSQRGAATSMVDVEEQGQPHSYFDTLLKYSEMWEPFARFTQLFMNHGIVALCQATGYYSLGRLYDKSERWAGLTMLGLFVVMAALIFYEQMRPASGKTEPSRPSPGWSFLDVSNIAVVFGLVLGPMLGGLADKSDIGYPEGLFIMIIAYLSHVFVYLIFLCRLLSISLGFNGKSKNGDGDGASVEDSQGSQTNMHHVIGARDLEEARAAPKSERDPEGLLAEMLEEHTRDIITRNTTGWYPLVASTAVVLTAWIVMLIWLPLHHDLRSACQNMPGVKCLKMEDHELMIEDLPLPGDFFSARGIACDQGSVFVADDFSVFAYSMQDSHVHLVGAVECNLTGMVKDISATCDQSGACWPVVLSSGGPGGEEVVDCSASASPLHFGQGTHPSDGLLAPIGAGRATTLHSGGWLTDLEWRAGSFQPLWSMGAVDITGGRAIDIVNVDSHDRLVMVFHSDWADEGFAAIAVHSLNPPHPPSLDTVWRLPSKSKRLLGGCAFGADDALLLVQGDDGRPKLASVRLTAWR